MEKKYLLKPEGEKESGIYFADFGDKHKCEMKVAEIRFEAKVKIFDVQFEGIVEKHIGKTPQYLVCEQKFTHDLLENADPYIIGRMVVDGYMKLKVHAQKHFSDKL